MPVGSVPSRIRVASQSCPEADCEPGLRRLGICLSNTHMQRSLSADRQSGLLLSIETGTLSPCDAQTPTSRWLLHAAVLVPPRADCTVESDSRGYLFATSRSPKLRRSGLNVHGVLGQPDVPIGGTGGGLGTGG